ncbi:MAG: PEP/pyruvate-binding domain-containing protein [bacterium]|nr:PEP/pyruvate-binding domain-containing protein [bacterium]
MVVGALFKHWSLRFLAPDTVLRRTYDAFKDLLKFDIQCHELMAEFEELYYQGRREDFAAIRVRYRKLSAGVQAMLAALERMQPGRTTTLREYFIKYDFYAQMLLEPPERFLTPPWVVDHEELHPATLVGNKSHSLLRIQQAQQADVPAGFSITVSAAAMLMVHNRLRPAMDLLLARMDTGLPESVAACSSALMTLVRSMEIPAELSEAVFDQYDRMALAFPEEAPPLVAVRSSAMQEDGRHSFAGQYHSALAVPREEILSAYLEVLASKYTPEALLYRIHTGLSDEEADMAVLVLAMIDAAASGVAYSRMAAPEGGAEQLLVQSVYGLGQPLVQGEVVPDRFVFSPPENEDPVGVYNGRQDEGLYMREGELVLEALPQNLRQEPAITAEEATLVAAQTRLLEQAFGRAQDVEWVLDSARKLHIVQSRPLKQEEQEDASPKEERLAAQDNATAQEADADLPEPLISDAVCASAGACHGRVCHVDELDSLKDGEQHILVSRQIPPSLVRYLDRLCGVVCERGATTGHFATVCREFGVVLLVDADGAVEKLPSGAEITVHGSSGKVYGGKVEGLLHSAAQEPARNSGYHQKIHALLQYITPLHLTDPDSPEFKPQSCRSLHDIIRYSHETAVRTMFGLSDIASGASSRSRKLDSPLPVDVYLLDVGGGYAAHAPAEGALALNELACRPFVALWQGLSHPEVDWDSHAHFDWKSFADVSLSDGISGGGAKDYASYAVLSEDYVNLNMRFGFHFTLVDCLCGPDRRANYCQLRFAGGGGDYSGRSARIDLLERILIRLGFLVRTKGDLLDARVEGFGADELPALLVDVGRLLGMTKLLDMVVQTADLQLYINQFFAGAGRFTAPSRAAE